MTCVAVASVPETGESMGRGGEGPACCDYWEETWSYLLFVTPIALTECGRQDYCGLANMAYVSCLTVFQFWWGK